MADPKTTSTTSSAPDLEILGDQVTLHPSGYVEQKERKYDSPDRNLVEHMARFRESPFDFLREVSLYVSGTGWRAYDSRQSSRWKLLHFCAHEDCRFHRTAH